MKVEDFGTIKSELEKQMEQNRAFANRVWSPDYVDVWMAGEIALSELTGIVPDFSKAKPNGDGGVDSYININVKGETRRMTINIKTSKKPYNLIAEDNRNKADIYILAQYFPETKRANLLGWEFGSKLYKAAMVKIPVKDGYKEFHGIALHELRDIQILRDKMEERK
jgi:hypothetical protein